MVEAIRTSLDEKVANIRPVQAVSLPLRKTLGDKTCEDYLEQVVLPELERLGADGSISPQQLSKIANAVQDRGIDVLAADLRFLDAVTLNTVERDGYIAEASLQLTEDVAIRHIVKKSSSKEDFDTAVRVQKELCDLLEGTAYDGQVPALPFINRRKRITITPFVEGNTLKSLQGKYSEIYDIQRLEEVIDDYVGLYNVINTEEFKERLDLPERLADFNEYFVKAYSDDSELAELFKQDIGNDLNAAKGSNVHGDLHGNNILVNGKIVYLDWASASSDGFFEFDLRKLLTKSNLDMKTEYELAMYAAEKLHEGDKDRQNKSFEIYVKNKILQELVAVKRYLKMASEAEGDLNAKKLKNMATVLYNDATRRVEDAKDRDIVSEEFLDAVRVNAPGVGDYKVKNLWDSDYLKLKARCNPHQAMTQENASPVPLVDIVEENTGADIAKIRKEIRKSKWKRAIYRVMLPVLGLSMIAGVAVGAAVGAKNLEERRNEIERQEDILFDSQLNMETIYRRNFTGAFEQAKNDIIDERVENGCYEIGDEIVDQIAEKYSLEPKILRNMLESNRLYGWQGVFRENERTSDVNILDPLLADRGFSFGDATINPLENLDQGAVRLAELVAKHDGDMKAALSEFYTPQNIDLGNMGSSNCPECAYNFIDPENPHNEIIFKDIRKLVYSAMNYGPASDNIGSLYFAVPREEDF